MIRLPRLLAALSVLLVAGAAAAQEVVHHRVPGSDVPISQAVEIPDGRALVFLSSFGPFPSDDKHASAHPGDTKAQTVAVLKRIEDALARIALTHADVVKMQVFLVADPKKGGKSDLAGFTEGYKQFYGTPAQPNLPARSLVQVAGLVNPAWLVQIEVTAVRPRAR